MSSAAESETTDAVMFCASCGTAGGDGIKLKKCTACHLVKYCSVKCQKDHRSKHKKECKKRAAELRDELLFKQPESSHLGDCPICCLPLPVDPKKSELMPCCCKRICDGCDLANTTREAEGRHEHRCPFCRKVAPETVEEYSKLFMKRTEANDPVAICYVGKVKYHEGDYKSAFEYFTRSAALGDAEAHFQLWKYYYEGKGVEKDEKKQLYHLKEAAIGGHPDARHNLGCHEGRNGRMDRAVKHFVIAAKLGFDDSLDTLKEAYKAGHASKEDFATALSGYQAANEATKSPQREEAYEFLAAFERPEI